MPAMEAEEGNTCGMLPYLEVHKKNVSDNDTTDYRCLIHKSGIMSQKRSLRNILGSRSAAIAKDTLKNTNIRQ